MEFERSGAKFAQLAEIRYSTFANWVRRRRERRVSADKAVNEKVSASEAVGKSAPLRLLEAVLKGGSHAHQPSEDSDGSVIELPGWSRMLVGSPAHVDMAAELVALISPRARARC